MAHHLLAIDVGNSHVVVGCFVDGVLEQSFRIGTNVKMTADELRVLLGSLLAEQGFKFDQVDAVALSSVVPTVTRNFLPLAADKDLLVVEPNGKFSFTIDVPLPEQLGVDRLVNAEAALTGYGAPVIVIDSGTATTFCAIDGDRRYLGGAITPGIEISTAALFSRASRLASVDLRPPPSVIGKTTETNLQSGIIFGYASLVDGMVQRIKQELKAPAAKVVGTGGWMEVLRPVCKEVDAVDRDLTLFGLYCCWSRARGNPMTKLPLRVTR
jgi:type III pantothenate kinase